jgi:NAD(P)-dependent dehydrogenase (short-subunit alcohol dehydrogenase family)
MPRTVVVGGVGPTVGASVARRFAQEGDRVALWARSERFTEELATDLTAETDGEALAVQADVTEPATVASAADTVREAYGAVDVYVHNVPAPGWSGPLDASPEDLLVSVEAAGYGLALVVDEFLDDLREDGGTVIHNTGDFLQWVSLRMAEQLAPEGGHVVHTFIDGLVDAPSAPDSVPDEARVDPDQVAAEYVRLVEQDPSVWTFETDLRPAGDDTFRKWR